MNGADNFIFETLNLPSHFFRSFSLIRPLSVLSHECSFLICEEETASGLNHRSMTDRRLSFSSTEEISCSLYLAMIFPDKTKRNINFSKAILDDSLLS